MRKDFYQNLLKLSKQTKKLAEETAKNISEKGQSSLNEAQKLIKDRQQYLKKANQKLQELKKKTPNIDMKNLNNNSGISSLLKNLEEQKKKIAESTKDLSVDNIKNTVSEKQKQMNISSETIKKRLEETGAKVSEGFETIKKSAPIPDSEKIKKSAYQATESLKENAYQKGEEFKNQAGNKLNEIKKKIDVREQIKSTLKYIFWRLTLILAIGMFAYGFGSALPKVLRSYLRDTLETDKKDTSRFQYKGSQSDKVI